MGIVNLTDDSFSGDGLRGDTASAIEHGLCLVEQGAHILDLGAESSRPGAESVPEQQEIDRLVPVMEGLRNCGVPLSIDTAKTSVMSAVLDAGADMINDIEAFRATGALDIVAKSRAGVCLMHMKGEPRSMQHGPSYENVVTDVAKFLLQRVSAAIAAGIALNRISIDPGFGFGKSLEHNLELLRRLDELLVPNIPMMIGMSRKSMLGSITGRTVSERRAAGVAAHILAVKRGARIVRVHDVEDTRDALAVLQLVEGYQ